MSTHKKINAHALACRSSTMQMFYSPKFLCNLLGEEIWYAGVDKKENGKRKFKFLYVSL